MDNKKSVLINVVGKQFYSSHRDKIELTTVGFFEEKEDCYVLEYEERQEPPENAVQVRVQVRKSLEEVQMERYGDNHSCLLVKQGSRSQCQYGTEYGDMVMGLFGKKIAFYEHGGEGEFDFRYVIDMNGQVTSRNQVKITFKRCSPSQ